MFRLAASVLLLLCILPTTAHGSQKTGKRKPELRKIIAEVSIPRFGAEQIELLGKVGKSDGRGGGRGVSHPGPDTDLSGIWSFMYKVSVSKVDGRGAVLKFRMSYEADGKKHSTRRLISIKTNEISEVDFGHGIRLKAYIR
jgi:hypothetical protein